MGMTADEAQQISELEDIIIQNVQNEAKRKILGKLIDRQ